MGLSSERLAELREHWRPLPPREIDHWGEVREVINELLDEVERLSSEGGDD